MIDTSLTVAIIAALATILAAVVPYTIENLRYAPLVNKRQKQLIGSWRGTNVQRNNINGENIDVELLVEIKSSWRKVKMEALVKGGGTELKVHATGGFVWSDYLKLDYASKDTSIANFGSMILRLHANGKILKGQMIGYGSESEQLIFGTVTLNKIT